MDLICIITTLKQELHLATQIMAFSSFPRNRYGRIRKIEGLHALFGNLRQRLIAAGRRGRIDAPLGSQAYCMGLFRTIQRSKRSLTLAASGLATAALSVAMSPAALASEQRAQAPATFPNVQMEGFKLQRKDFRFGQFTGWLKRDGTWHIEGPVRHNGLLCGTYEVGVRFGIGEQECTNVQWVSEVTYVTSNEQCNNAERPHSGTEIDDSLVGQFDAINCAERVIRCTGTCK